VRKTLQYYARMRVIGAAALLFVSSLCYSQTNTLKVVFPDAPSRNTVIGAFRTKGILYASLTDLTQVFQVKTYTNLETAKIELKYGPYRVKLTGGNPFVVITDESHKNSVYQLSSNVMFAANTFFVPIQSALPYFQVFFEKTGRFDPATGTLTIGNAPRLSAFDVPSIAIEPKLNGMLIRVHAQKRIEDVESWLRTDGWFYVTLADVKADARTINATPRSGIVEDVVAIQSPTSVQLTFRLKGKIASTEILRDENSNDLLLSIRVPEPKEEPTPTVEKKAPVIQETKQDVPQVQPSAPPPENKPAANQQDTKTPDTNKPDAIKPEPKKQEVKEEAKEAKPEAEPTQPTGNTPDLNSHRKRWGLDVVVLDPGHGGYDPGTIGVSGTKEKEITLGVAKKLGQLIKSDRGELKDVKVVFTRSTDEFIPLYRRGQIANESGGKLFISIHCNSTAKKPNPQRGFEVYLLRPGRTEEAIAIAEQENRVIRLEEGYEDHYKELNDENFILVTMAQSAYMRSSERLAELVQKQMASVAGLKNLGVKQAGFYVLVGAAMPNILVETAFLSNREDEKFLRSAAGQQKIAEAIYRAVKKYKTEYEKLLAGE
jgi:N-acetylmuramoyl-L-alanine amidase